MRFRRPGGDPKPATNPASKPDLTLCSDPSDPGVRTKAQNKGGSVVEGGEGGVAAGRRRVAGQGALGGESQQVVRAAGLGAGAAQALAAEGLDADHRADLVAVDVAVAHLHRAGDLLDGGVDARMDAQGQAVAGGIDLRK